MSKVFLGDCLEVMDELIAKGIKVDAIITDPPYGTTACKWDSVIPFAPMWERLGKLIKPNGAIVLFGSEPFSSALRMSNIKQYKYDWVWLKERGTGFLNAKKMPLRDSETVSVFYDKQCTYVPQMREGEPYTCKNNPSLQKGTNRGYKQVVTENGGERYPLTTLPFSRPRNPLHPTQKPVALLEYFIKTYTNPGELVLDFTAGSGTTGVACINTQRAYILIEKEPKYYDIINNRLADAWLKGLGVLC